jgi:hypothetical protein
MAQTRKQIITALYGRTHADIQARLGADAQLLPGLDEVEASDIVLMMAICFPGDSEPQWRETTRTLAKSRGVAIDVGVEDVVVGFLREFKALR